MKILPILFTYHIVSMLLPDSITSIILSYMTYHYYLR